MKIRNLSISKKMLLLALIPGLSYLFLAGRTIYGEMSAINQSDSHTVRFEAIRLISDVIKNTQVERGRTAVFIKAPSNENKQKLDQQKSTADNAWQKSLESFDANPLLSEFGDIIDLKGDVDYFRSTLDENTKLSDILPQYTEVVQNLMIIQSNLGQQTTENLQILSQNNIALQDAREAAGLSKAHLSSTFAADSSISASRMTMIMGLQTKRNLSLDSKLLQLSHSTEDLMNGLRNGNHWAFTNEAFSKIKSQYATGSYGFSANETFRNTSAVVDDIGNIIEANINDAISEINSSSSSALNNLALQSLGIFLNLVIIYIVSWYFMRSIHRKIDELVNDLSNSSDKSHASSISISSSSERLSKGAQQTASAIQETVSSMSEINSMVSATLDKSKQTNSSSELVTQRVTQGADTVERLVGAMKEIKESNSRLREVNDIMTAISKQTNLINDIVFKTQLLAVNASIESAKAGEHGRGFSVVSEEVSKLAQSSGDAASKITDLIESSNKKVSQLLNSINERVFSGTEYTEEVQSLFAEISSEIKDINSRAKDMNHAAKEQSLGIDQITKAVSNIDKSTQRNLKEIHQFETMVDDLKSQSTNLLTLSDKLNFMAYAKRKHHRTNTNSGKENRSLKKPSVVNINIPIANEIEKDDLADDPSFKQAAND